MDTNQLTVQPQLHSAIQIRKNSIVQYTPPPKKAIKSLQGNSRNFKKGGKNPYCGKMTNHSTKRARRVVDIMDQITPERIQFNIYGKKEVLPKMVFITLTFSQNLTLDQEKNHYELFLKPFIQWMVRRQEVRHYIWKVERTKLGRYHYHLIINKFIGKKILQFAWNRILRNSGMHKEYFKVHKHFYAPSTHIVPVKNSSMLSAYISKYFSKTEQNKERVFGKVWGCCRILRGQVYFSFREAVRLNALILMKAARSNYQFILEHCNILNLNPLSLLRKYAPDYLDLYRKWTNSLFNYIPDFQTAD